MSLAIRVRGLAKRYGYRWVLRGLDWDVATGQIVVVLGPNAAGKTTLLRILASLTRFQAGEVTVLGAQLPQEAVQVRRHVGYLGHASFLYPDLSALQNLRFYARLYGLDHAEARIRDVLERVDLWHRRHDPVRIFSRGMVQRLALARTLLPDPVLLLLDEPFTGLDQDAAAVLLQVLRDLAGQGRTLVLTSHDLERVLPLAHRFDLLYRGRIQATLEGHPGLTVEALRTWYADQLAQAEAAP